MTKSKRKILGPGPQFKIDVAALSAGPLRVQSNFESKAFAERLRHCEYEVTPLTGSVDIAAELSGEGVLLRGTIQVRIRTQCVLCLRDIELYLSPSVSTFLMRRSEEMKEVEDRELTPDDLEKEWFQGDEIVLDDILYDIVMLELPMNPKCTMNCPGIANDEIPDTNQKIDPRLAPLAAFRVKKES